MREEPRQQNDAIRGNRQSRLRRFIPGQGADGGSGLVPVSRGLCGKRTRRIVRRPMQSQLFLPTARQTNWLLLITLLAVALATTAFGLVLHNANLAGVAAALLMLSLARPAPAAE